VTLDAVCPFGVLGPDSFVSVCAMAGEAIRPHQSAMGNRRWSFGPGPCCGTGSEESLKCALRQM